MYFAVLPAAGQSSRMGRPKLSLPLKNRTVLEQVIVSLRSGGVNHVVAVVKPDDTGLLEIAKKAGALVCTLSQPTQHMRETVEHGLRWLEDHFRPHPDDGWFLTPADNAAFSAKVVRQLCDRYDEFPSILIPVFAGQRGHPTLIPWRLVSAIRAHPPHEGLNKFLRQHDDETKEVPVDDAGVLVDLDTAADYQRLEFKSKVPNAHKPIC